MRCIALVFLVACNGSSSDSPDSGIPDSGISDIGIPSEDAGPATSPYGDRNLGVVEPYPDSVLIQNGGRFYNVRKPPGAQTTAKGDGSTDDTAAFLDAFDYLRAAYVAANPTGSPTAGYTDSNYWIYVPDGTYRVSSTLNYRTKLVSPTFGSDLVRIRIMGQSREHTVVQLADNASGFGDVGKPATVLEFQHDGTTFNNAPAANVLANITIDIGKGNPGATALWFQGANLTSMHNILVRSSDGQGHCGIAFPTGSLQGYYRDITVIGFDYGICQTANAEVDSALEHITLRGQNKAGVLVQGGGMSLRAAEIDEVATHAEGIRIEQAGAVVLVDYSWLHGSAVAAIDVTSTDKEALFVRDLMTNGFGPSILRAGTDVGSAANVAWYATSAPVVLVAGAQASLGLAVEDTPLSAWHDPATEWADVDAFGAKGDGTTDDTAAIVAAIASGKPVIVFPKAKYLWKSTLHIPATVERMDFMYSDVSGGMVVDAPSVTPVRFSYHPGYGGVTLTATRPVVIADSSGGFGNTSGKPAKVYIENAANMGGGPQFSPAGQLTWARGLNDEQGAGGNPDVDVVGGTLWLFGYKTENKAVTSVSATDGARVEVLNGYVNMTEAPGATPMLVNHGSAMSYIGFTNLGAAIHGPFQNIIEESTPDGGTTTLTYSAGFGSSLPVRGGYAADFVVPLYVGGTGH